MTYRADFWIGSVAGIVVKFAVAAFIVGAIFRESGAGRIGGFTYQEMLLYYVTVVLMGLFVQTSEREQSVSQEIYEGGLTRHLLYPVSYGTMKYAQQIAAAVPALIQATLLTVWVPWAVGIPEGLTWGSAARGLAALAAANMLHFLLTYPVQLVAFWADNVWSLLVMHRFASALLGGMLVPLALFPEGARRVLELLPFRYLYAFPVEAFLGRVPPRDWAAGMVLSAAWCGVFTLIGRAVWRRGMLEYTGVGI